MDSIEQKILTKLKPHLIEREGVRLKVYRDSLGKPTVGVGHLVTARDGLEVGDEITKAKMEMFLTQDALTAIKAAIIQAKEMGVSDIDFIVALASVNFQLSEGWVKKFYNTWSLLKRGEYFAAIDNIEKSLWAKQTPVRTRDFVSAITFLALRQKPKKDVPTGGKVVTMSFNKKGK